MERDRLFEVLFEDESLLVVHKPADLVCHPTKGDIYSSLISRVRLYLPSEATGAHMINRLDRETSGLVLIAKDKETARLLARQWESRSVVKTYRALVLDWPEGDTFEIHASLGKDLGSAVYVKDTVCEDGTPASTHVRVLKRFEREGKPYSLLEVCPLTGRKHQIRIHLQSIGHSIVGDKLYGLDERYYLSLVDGTLTDEDRANLLLPYQALHAQSVSIDLHGERRTFTAREEAWFEAFHAAYPDLSHLEDVLT